MKSIIEYILESLSIADKLDFIPISADDVLDMDDLTIFNDIGKNNLVKDFYTTDHYKIMFGDIFVGVIGYKSYYDTWKDIPGMVPDGKGKHSLWVQMLEIRKDARQKIGNPLVLIKSIFDYLNDYCKQNGFKSILCSAKTDRIAELYKRAGFIGPDKDHLAYLVK